MPRYFVGMMVEVDSAHEAMEEVDAEIDIAAEFAMSWRPTVLDRVRCEDTGEEWRVVDKETEPLKVLVRELERTTTENEEAVGG